MWIKLETVSGGLAQPPSSAATRFSTPPSAIQERTPEAGADPCGNPLESNSYCQSPTGVSCRPTAAQPWHFTAPVIDRQLVFRNECGCVDLLTFVKKNQKCLKMVKNHIGLTPQSQRQSGIMFSGCPSSLSPGCNSFEGFISHFAHLNGNI